MERGAAASEPEPPESHLALSIVCDSQPHHQRSQRTSLVKYLSRAGDDISNTCVPEFTVKHPSGVALLVLQANTFDGARSLAG